MSEGLPMVEFKGRFEKHYIKKSDWECWPWTGHTHASKSGLRYGKFRIGKKMCAAHRISYQVYKCGIPEGNVVRHSCDNPSCVNPNHLIAGTQKENVADQVSRGRHPLKQRTHCLRGHELFGENLYVCPRGLRNCKSCQTERERIWRAKSKVRKNGP